MIITSPIPFQIGKIYTEKDIGMPFEVPDKSFEQYTFQVLREATEQEFIEEIKRMYSPEIALDIVTRDYFYQISMD